MKMGSEIEVAIPALNIKTTLEITYINPLRLCYLKTTKLRQFDARTFEVRATP